MIFEALLLRFVDNEVKIDMLFFLVPTSIFLFLALAFTEIDFKYQKVCNTMKDSSTIVYITHMLVFYMITNFFFYFFNITLDSLSIYLLTIFLSTLLSLLIIKLSNYKCLSFLKYLK